MDELVKLLGAEAGKCISCGFCESVCPTLPVSGYRSIYGARGRVLLGKQVYDDIVKSKKTALHISDSFYSCLDCYACFYVCPAGVNAGHVAEYVKRIVTSKKYTTTNQEKPVAKMVVNATKKYQNPLGLKTPLTVWADTITFDTHADTLLYTGNMYQLMAYSSSLTALKKLLGESVSEFFAKYLATFPAMLKVSTRFYDKRLKEIMNNTLKNIVKLLNAAQIKFAYLGATEPYPGTFLYDLGYIQLFKSYAARVTQLFHSKKIKKIITVDPHTYELLKNIYPQYVANFDFQVYHYLQLLENLKFEKTSTTVTYHEPCHFTMHSEQYTLPTTFISKIATLKLPKRHGTNTLCCGGPDELLYTHITERISNIRYAQLKATKATKIITACPICFVNLAKEEGMVQDLANFLAEHLL